MQQTEERYISLLTDFGYEDSLKAYRDVKNSIDTAMEQGKNEGRASLVNTMLQRGADIKTIAALTGMTEDDIRKLRRC